MKGIFVIISEAISQYLRYIDEARGFAGGTIKQRRIYLSRFLGEFEGRQVETISNRDVDNYHIAMLKVRNKLGNTPSVGTVNTSIRAVKVFLKWCIEYQRLEMDIRPTEIRLRKQPEKHPEIILFSQVSRVVEQCENTQDRLMIAVMFEAGLRIAELVNMRVEHLAENKLSVVGKGDRHRITFISDELSRELLDWCNKNGWDNGPVFRPLKLGVDGLGYRNIDTVRERIKKVFKDTIGLEMHPHQLRHAFALNLLENGCGLRSIQKLLGHAKIETTMIYLGITDKFLEKEYVENFGGTVLTFNH